ncbi:MAG: RNA methyltransferase [Roseitalea sp.]|jgi:tRNA G18 (ribose-2'-O)-methylase SpoU|nr:RNA methyltransferase [Roseitalea sp.]MBO6723933.1 RNA methyltransferase [Roseitalea sp.]MBO6741816.1 RNA methyltransferase [Roseitalea sp.]
MTGLARPTPIVDAGDPRIAAYRDIRERDLVRHQRRFIAEGTSVLRVLAGQRRFGVESVFLLENRLPGVADILGDLPEETPVYVAGSAVMDHVAGFPMHRGVLAVGLRRDDADGPPVPNTAKNWNTVVALSGIANHDNMGAIFRNAAALGADAVLMDAQSCDPLYRKALRVSVGGVLTVPWHRFQNAGAMVDWLEGNGFALAGLSPGGDAALETWHPPDKVALVLGTEGPGLAQPIMDRTQTLRIAMANGFDSLNVATSAALVLHHVRCARAQLASG